MRSTDRLRPHRAVYHVVGFYFLIRLLDAAVMVMSAGGGSPHADPSSTYQDVATNWDGNWYASIARAGYPSSATGPGGEPIQTSLAFYPLFPMLCRGLSVITTLPFSVVGPALSLASGAVATALMFALLQRAVGVRRAVLGCCAVNVFPAAPVLQVAYTESLALALVATVLLLLHRRQYLAGILPVLLLGLTRNIALVVGAVVLAHWVVVWRAHRHGAGPPVAWLKLAALLASTLLAVVAWPVIAAVITGDPRAYSTTMKAWPGYSTSVLRPPWLEAIGSTGTSSLLLAGIVALGFGTIMALPATRAWGVELWSWAVAYPVYVFLATGFTTSILRYLLLAFPLALAVVPAAVTARDRMARSAMFGLWCVVGLIGQYVWITRLLQDTGHHGGFP